RPTRRSRACTRRPLPKSIRPRARRSAHPWPAGPGTWRRRPGSAPERRRHRRGGAQGYGTGSYRNVIDAAMDALATWTGVLHGTAAAVLTLAGEINGGVNAVQIMVTLLRHHRLVGSGADGFASRGVRARRRG